ncbi:hypothetical protein J14TS2_34600 [Bacillus sp. J14TS2]|nr:hypothetical protein J14TS2_34600 [Bacillus sp. J14TS2]
MKLNFVLYSSIIPCQRQFLTIKSIFFTIKYGETLISGDLDVVNVRHTVKDIDHNCEIPSRKRS